MDEKPILLRRLQPVWQVWQVLSAARPIIGAGFGASPGAIPFTEIDAYARRFGPHDEDDFDELLTLIRSMDGAYLQCESERMQPKSKKKTPKGKGKKKAAR